MRRRPLCVITLCVVAVIGIGQFVAHAQGDRAAQLRNAEASIQAAASALKVTSATDRHYTPEVEREQTAALKASLNQYVVAFNAGNRETVEPGELAAALRRVYDPWTGWADSTNTPVVTGMTVGNRRFLLVSWLLFRGGIGIPPSKGFIQAFSASGGALEPIASTGDEFDGHGLLVRQIPSPVPNQAWLLAYGQRFGDTGSRSDVVLYAFDGTRFTTKWSRNDLPLLQLELADSTLRLKYSRKKFPPDPKTGFAFDDFVEEYRVTPKGLEPVRAPARQH